MKLDNIDVAMEDYGNVWPYISLQMNIFRQTASGGLMDARLIKQQQFSVQCHKFLCDAFLLKNLTVNCDFVHEKLI